MIRASFIGLVFSLFLYSSALLAADEESDFAQVQSSIMQIQEYGSVKNAHEKTAYFALNGLEVWQQKYCVDRQKAACSKKQYQKIQGALRQIQEKLHDVRSSEAFLKDSKLDRDQLEIQFDKGLDYLLKKLNPDAYYKKLSEFLSRKSPPSIVDPVLDPKILQHVLNPYLNNASLNALSQRCQMLSQLNREELKQRKARKELEELIGPFIEIKKGGFMMGRTPNEPNHWGNEPNAPIATEISADYKMAKYKETQGQYKQMMGEEVWKAYEGIVQEFCSNQGHKLSHFLGDNLPIFLLTRAEENLYIEKKNEKIKELYAKAYPQADPEKAPRMRKPTEEEWEYSTTKPLAPEAYHDVILHEGTDQEKIIQMTAEHRLYPGADREEDLPQKRNWRDGPRPVNDPALKVSERGLVGLERNGWDVMGTPYTRDLNHPDPNSPDFALRGGYWGYDAPYCRSSSRNYVGPRERRGGISLRLVMDP